MFGRDGFRRAWEQQENRQIMFFGGRYDVDRIRQSVCVTVICSDSCDSLDLGSG